MLAVNASAHSQPTARDRLNEAAIELFATRGFQAIGLRDLAGHMGLQAGSLYHHIDNKQGLLFELIESALSDLLVLTKRRMKGARTPCERLRRFVQAFVAFNLREQHRLILVTREFVNLNDEHKQQADALKQAYRKLLSDIIADEYALTDTRDGEVRLITQAVIGLLYGHLQWYEGQTTERQRMEVLENCVLCIIASGKQTTR